METPTELRPASIAFSSTAIFMALPRGEVSYTAYCPRDMVRVPKSGGGELPLLYECVSCPTGTRSLGGVTPCVECVDAAGSPTQCIASSGEGSPWINASAYTDLSEAGLLHGDEFAIEIRASNARQGRGLGPLATALSARVRLDLTPPTLGIVYDIAPCTVSGCTISSNPTIDYSLPTSLIAARWDGFVDGESDVRAYHFCVGSSPRQCDVVPMAEIVNATSVQVALPSAAEHGSRRCFSVEAINGVELRSERASSRCFLVDGTPPVMMAVRISSDPEIHMDEQSDAAVVFGAAIASDDITLVDQAEYCLARAPYNSSDSVRGSAAGGDNFSDWALAACDLTPLKVAPSENASLPGKRTNMIFGTATDIPIGSEIYLGARSRNTLGLFSAWMWSAVTKIGSMAAAVDPEAGASTLMMEVAIPAYGSESSGDGEASAEGAQLSTLGVSNKTKAVKYEKMSSSTRRRLDLSHAHSLAEAAEQEPDEAGTDSAEPPSRFSHAPYPGRRLQSGASTIHDSTAAFTLALTGSSEEVCQELRHSMHSLPLCSHSTRFGYQFPALAQVFEYSNLYNTTQLLLASDPARDDPTLLARFQPTLLAFVGSSWVEARTTCNPIKHYATVPGLYRCSVCSSANATQFKLTFQATPTADSWWAEQGCNGTSACNTSSPAFLQKYIQYGEGMATRRPPPNRPS